MLSIQDTDSYKCLYHEGDTHHDVYTFSLQCCIFTVLHEKEKNSLESYNNQDHQLQMICIISHLFRGLVWGYQATVLSTHKQIQAHSRQQQYHLLSMDTTAGQFSTEPRCSTQTAKALALAHTGSVNRKKHLYLCFPARQHGTFSKVFKAFVVVSPLSSMNHHVSGSSP